MNKIIRVRKPLIALLVFALVTALTGTGMFAVAAGETSPASAAKTIAEGYDVTKNGAGKGGDDTQAIQSALDQNSLVFIPDGLYYINADRSLRLRSNQTLTLSDGATLQALPSANPNPNAVVMIDGVTNSNVTGGRIVGDRDVHRGTAGEYGMGVFVKGGASHITVSNMTVSGCWGDGVYLGEGTSPVTDILVKNVISDGNRRRAFPLPTARTLRLTDAPSKIRTGRHRRPGSILSRGPTIRPPTSPSSIRAASGMRATVCRSWAANTSLTM